MSTNMPSARVTAAVIIGSCQPSAPARFTLSEVPSFVKPEHMRYRPSAIICLVYDHHCPLNTAARKFQKLLTSPEEAH